MAGTTPASGGLDTDHYYAQLTPNGVDDSDGAQISISPPRYVIGSVTELLRLIAHLIEVPVDAVDQAMVRGLAMSRGQLVTLVPLPETDR